MTIDNISTKQTESHYYEGAYNSQHDPLFKKHQRYYHFDNDDMDLRCFSNLPYQMVKHKANLIALWHTYHEDGKASYYYPEIKVARLKNRHQQFFNQLTGPSVFFKVLLYWSCVMAIFIVTPMFFFVNFLNWINIKSMPVLEIIFDGVTPWLLSISIIIFALLHHYGKKVRTNFGVTFDRPSGKVKFVSKDGSSQDYDFKHFYPVLTHGRSPRGGALLEITMLVSKVYPNLLFTIDGNDFVRGVAMWNFLVNFMDVSKPLPDIPEQEETRHLDPTTKAYDLKTGRDPYYWRKKSYQEIKDIQKDHYDKAKQWIDDRNKQLGQRKIKESLLNNRSISGTYLNELINQTQHIEDLP